MKNNALFNICKQHLVSVKKEDGYNLERKYGFKNLSWIKKSIKEWLIESFKKSNNEKELQEKLERRGKVESDVNGLKSINDLAGHGMGDLYLDRIANVFANNALIKEFAKKYGIAYTIAREGGDEFGFLLKRKSGSLYEIVNGDELILSFSTLIMEEIKKIKATDLLGLNNPHIKKLLGQDGNRMLKIAGKDYEYYSSIATGQCTFFDAYNFLGKILKGESTPSIFQKIRNNIEEITSENNWEKYVINILMGLVQDISGLINQVNKDDFKKNLSSGNDKERFTAFLFYRNDESRQLYLEVQRLREEIKRLKKNIKILQNPKTDR